MRATYAVEAGGSRTVEVQSDLAHGTTVWLDGKIVADDASWSVERSYPLPVPGAVASVSVAGGWPRRRSATLVVNGKPVSPGATAPASLEPRRPIPAWGHAFSGIAMAGLLGGLLLLPLPILCSFAALRASRSDRAVSSRFALSASCAAAPWLAVSLLHVHLIWQPIENLLRDGGPIMFLTVVAGLSAAAFAITHAVQAHRYSAIRALAATALAAGIGVCATWAAGAKADEMLEMVNPADVAQFRTLFEAEVPRPRRVGLVLAGAAAVFLATGEVRRFSRR
jgi:hypothetical protein